MRWGKQNILTEEIFYYLNLKTQGYAEIKTSDRSHLGELAVR